MVESEDTIIDDFIRKTTEPFTLSQYFTVLEAAGEELPQEMCIAYLMTSNYVFPRGSDYFITCAGAFTGKYFSIKPTRAEAEQGMFVVGGRCLPFVDMALSPQSLTFRLDGEAGKELEQKVGEFTSGEAVDMFAMFGVEFAPQCIACDPANSEAGLDENSAELPAKVHLTGFAIDIKTGDRLLCRVADWDEGVVDISIVHGNKSGATVKMRTSDIKRHKWYVAAENALLKCFDTVGPCSSIGEQLAMTVINNTRSLCVKDCGSFAECVAQSDKIGYELYGVESRLWHTGVNVPAVGKWDTAQDEDAAGDRSAHLDMIEECVGVTDFVIDAIILEDFYQNYKQDRQTTSKEIALDIVRFIVPEEVELTRQEMQLLSLHIIERYDILEKDYNWFADARIAKVREGALNFYVKLRDMAIDVCNAEVPLDKYPQQELVLYKQIFTNVMKILNMMVSDSEYAAQVLEDTQTTLNTMQCDYTEVEKALNRTITEEEKRKKAEAKKNLRKSFVVIG